MDYKTIQYETVETGIGVLSLNRPRRYNAVNPQMAEELEDFWRGRRDDLDTHIIVLRGNGDRNFCAGLDMKAAMKILPDMDTDRFYGFQARLARITLAMR
jgi:enoyl-CoA hydratase/carnithine racemase